jgi:type IV pilus assembly protein PilA
VYSRLMVRLLQKSASKTQGFTLLELVVVVLITGILAAIAIPSFLSRANTAKQVEAKMYLGSLNRSQQAFYTQHGKFAGTLEELGLQNQPTSYYQYQVKLPGDGTPRAIHYANSKYSVLRSYSGTVALVQQGNVMQAILCEAEKPSADVAPDPTYSDASVTCADGTKPLN